MLIPCEILIEDSPVIIYASRNGKPDKVLRLLKPFLEKFSEERKTSGEFTDTPECLAAQVIVRFGFEICEDDFSNLKVGTRHFPEVAYLYHIDQQLTITIWQPTADYHRDPSLGLAACQPAEWD